MLRPLVYVGEYVRIIEATEVSTSHCESAVRER